jgi:hypothetical protein
LPGQSRPDSLWVEVDPPLSAPRLNIPGPDVKDVILATRHVGASLQPVNESPVHVYICRALRDDIYSTGRFEDADVKQIEWGEVYSMLAAAEASR